MSARSQDLVVFKKNDITISVTVTDQDGNVVDITGGTVTLTVKENYGDADPGALQIIVLSGALTDPANGQTNIVIADTDTTSVDVGNYLYDIQLNTAGGDIYTLVLGNFLLKDKVKD